MADFPGDLDVTLDWKVRDRALGRIVDDVASRALVSAGGKVRVIPAGERRPVREVNSVLKEG